jgi:hypothetical protein
MALCRLQTDACRRSSALLHPIDQGGGGSALAAILQKPTLTPPSLVVLWIQTDSILERLFEGAPACVNKLSGATDDVLALRSLIGTSHQAIRALGLPVLPPFERFGNRIVNSYVPPPGLPKYREPAHVPGDQWVWVIHVAPLVVWMLSSSDAPKLFMPTFRTSVRDYRNGIATWRGLISISVWVFPAIHHPGGLLIGFCSANLTFRNKDEMLSRAKRSPTPMVRRARLSEGVFVFP